MLLAVLGCSPTTCPEHWLIELRSSERAEARVVVTSRTGVPLRPWVAYVCEMYAETW